MLEGIYLVTHGGVVPGRERFVPKLFDEAVEFWRRQADVTTIGPYFLTPGSGPRDHMAFMSMYRGNLARLHQIITSPEYERLWAGFAQVAKNLSGRLYGGGTRKELEDIMRGSAEEWTKRGFVGE
jgi:hypothetical protein